jgi:hypothetical protein
MIAERTGTLKIRDDKRGPEKTVSTPATARISESAGSGIRRRETFAEGAALRDLPAQAGSGQDLRDSGQASSAPAAPGRAVLANITDQQWIVHRTYGTYIVSPCAPGEQTTLLEITPRVGRIDLGDKREYEFPITAREIADDIAREINSDAGEGSDFGVFVCAGERPTEEEIAAARGRMEAFYKRIVVQADQEWERAHNAMTISDVQRRGARWLKLEREWFYEPARQAECPACGERIRPGVAVCRTCGAVLDKAKAAQFGLAAEETVKPRTQTDSHG